MTWVTYAGARAWWCCPLCPYEIQSDHPWGGVREAVREHERAHTPAGIEDARKLYRRMDAVLHAKYPHLRPDHRPVVHKEAPPALPRALEVVLLFQVGVYSGANPFDPGGQQPHRFGIQQPATIDLVPELLETRLQLGVVAHDPHPRQRRELVV